MKISFNSSDWISFELAITLPSGKQEVKYIGDPKLGKSNWLYGQIQERPGPHMICDLNGKGLKWSEVKDGIEVKIRAKNVDPDYPTFEFLYSSEGKKGNQLIYHTQNRKDICHLIKRAIFWDFFILQDTFTTMIQKMINKSGKFIKMDL